MNCPVCESSRMREVEKNGILIDICPSCKGVWLDRGELEKLMQDVREVRQDYNDWYYGNDQGAGARPPAPPQQPHQQPPQQHGEPYGRQPHYGSHSHSHPHHKKKKSVLDVFGDLFD